MSIEIKLTFATLEEAISFLSQGEASPISGSVTTTAPVSTLPVTPSRGQVGRPKSVKTEAPAVTPPTASAEPAPTVEPAQVPASPPPVAEEAELPYAPLAVRIVAAISVANPKAADNRAALKALFAQLKTKDGAAVARGEHVQPADRPRLAALLDEIEGVV